MRKRERKTWLIARTTFINRRGRAFLYISRQIILQWKWWWHRSREGAYGRKYCSLTKRAPQKAIVLRPHWQYYLKRTGDRWSCNCCDDSKHAAPSLHAVTSTYPSCVDQPVQRVFFALVAINDHKVLMIHTLNGGPSTITKTLTTVHMFFLFYGVLKVTLKVVTSFGHHCWYLTFVQTFE